MLLRSRYEEQNRAALRLSILGSRKQNFFTNGAVELFDMAAQGRIDAFFLGGGQIDGFGNINLVGSGTYPQVNVRWPGSFGSAYLYSLISRVILFREEHSPRVLVEKVDFISAAGKTADPSRRGGPYALLTSMASFHFDAKLGVFRLQSVHPGFTASDVKAQTGFEYIAPVDPPITPSPDARTLAVLRGRVREELSETYPAFARSMGERAAASTKKSSDSDLARALRPV